MNRSEDGVRVDSGATTASVGGVVTAGRVFVGLKWSVRETIKGKGGNAYLLETQDVVCLGAVTGNDIGLIEVLGEDSTLSQRPVLNGSRKEGR